MRLYYTTSQDEGAVQQNVNLSLGGQRSGTQVPNGRLNNVFGDITQYTASNPTDEYIGLILRNETGSTAGSINVWFVLPADALSSLSLAAVTLSNGSMERIQSKDSQPLIGDFVTPDVNNKADLGNLDNNEAIGIWIRRTIDSAAIETLQTTGFFERDPDTVNKYRAITLETNEDIVFVIDWT